MAATDTVQARKAALLLHGLPMTARRQVIAKLAAAETERLRPLLDELAALGVPQSMSRELRKLTSLTQRDLSLSAATVPTLQQQVERLKAEDVVRCLQPCAAITAALLLRARAWPWQAQVLGLMPAARRAEVLDCMRNETVVLASAVLNALCTRLFRAR